MALNHRELTRRRALGTFAAAASGLVGCAAAPTHAAAAPSPKTSAPVPTSDAGIVPLPFRPDTLRGLSERMIVSHHEKNYGGAVRNLAAVEQQLAGITKETPAFVVAALRERELTFRNSKSLHEAYFGNLGGDGKPTRATASALATAFGSEAAWEEQFRASAAGLGGGSGWVVLSFELATAKLRIIGSGHHTQAQAEAIPLLVLDMYEHAYQIDYGAAAARYIDAFFANVNWDAVEQRRERAERLAAAWRG
jgi:Fe-Mn family superoxide dismutase